MEIYDKREVERIIKKAKEKYPVSFEYTGKLYKKELDDIEKVCDVKCSSVYIDGTATYHIRYTNEIAGEHTSETVDKSFRKQRARYCELHYKSVRN